MDDANRVVSGVVIRNGRFVEVDKGVPRHGRAIDLKGRTVVPGLIESHIHFVSLGNRPGHHVAIERARDIADIQELLAARPPVRAGRRVHHAMGGWHTTMFAEQRLPTLAELDAAMPDRPVYLHMTGSGPSATNSLGKAFFESRSRARSPARSPSAPTARSRPGATSNTRPLPPPRPPDLRGQAAERARRDGVLGRARV